MNTQDKGREAAARRVLAGVALLALIALAVLFGMPGAPSQAAPGGPDSVQAIRSLKNDVSPALRSLKVARPDAVAPTAPDRATGATASKDGALPTPETAWDGLAPGSWPADANGDIGTDQYVQVVNSSLQVWSKAGASLLGPLPLAQIWNGFGGPCASADQVFDPIVLYDALADRWFLGAAYAASRAAPNAPAGMCMAVSTSSDAAGTWNRYQFELSRAPSNTWYDLPRWAVWPDGYYMAAHAVSASGEAPMPFVFDRLNMLAGQPATAQQFVPPTTLQDILPVDFDGGALPERGAAGLFVEFPAQHDGTLATRLWRLHADWQTPANSSFTLATALPVASFQPLDCTAAGCITQPTTAQKLYTRPNLLLYRASYRKIGAQESVLFAHPAKGPDRQAAIRWYQIANPLGQASLWQQGTYAPTTAHRWAGSLAMDGAGNIALAYNASSGDTFPSLRYAVQMVNDRRGALSTAEGQLAAGGAAQPGTKWSDYSNLAVDPANGCTFWYSAPYLDEPGSAHTRIGSFRLPNCNDTAPSIPFKDVPADSYFDVPVYALFDMGAISGYSGAPCGEASPCFLPFNNVSRGQAAKILALVTNRLASPGNWTFQDVPPNNPFNLYVEGLARAGAISGYNCGGPGEECGPAQRPYFRLNSPLTRAQLVKIAALAAGLTAGSEGQLFADVPPSSPFYPYVQALASRGVINGYNCGGNDAEPCQAPANLPYFHPGNSITRGQAAKVIYLISRMVISPPQPTPTPLLTATPTVTRLPDSWLAIFYADRELLNYCGVDQFAGLSFRHDRLPSACPNVNYSVRFSRTITVNEPNTLHFVIDHDDGVRLYVDGGLYIDQWATNQTDSADVLVDPGTHDLVIEYNQIDGLAHLIVQVSLLQPTSTPVRTATPVVHGTATTPPSEDYWNAEYFADRNFSTSCDQEQIDNLFLDYDWGEGPTSNCPADNFSARFQRRINFAGGAYQFYFRHDDGGRLLVDGQTVIDNWDVAAEDSGTIILSGGGHDVRAEMNEQEGAAGLHLHWTLAATPTPQPQPPSEGWAARYFANANFGAICAQQVLTTTFLDINWGTSAPAPDCPDDRFSAYFDASRDLDAGNYEFTADHEDGVRVFVDDREIIDSTDPNSRVDTAIVTLNSAAHRIHVEYTALYNNAHMKLTWAIAIPTPTPAPPTPAATDRWVADYFATRDFGSVCAHEEFSDEFVDRDWGDDAVAGCPSDNFSARYVRRVFFEGGTYQFHADHDDGVRIYLDNRLVMDIWRYGPTDDVRVTVVPGEYNVRIDYDDELREAFIKVRWSRIP